MSKKKPIRRPKKSASLGKALGKRKIKNKPKSASQLARAGTGGGRVGGITKTTRARILAYQVNRDFGLYKELHSLIVKAVPESFSFIEKELKKVGSIKLAILTGVFLNTDNTRVDMLIVGEGIQLSKFTEFIKELEAGLGREIRYVLLSKDEFIYRYEMFDRFLGDILEYPHQKIINKLKI